MSDRVDFRPATPADLPAIVRLLAADQLGAQRESADEWPMSPAPWAACSS